MFSAPSRERPRLAIVFGYLHIFLLLGIVLLATGLKKAIPDPLDPLDDAAAVVLAAGTALFVAADTVFLRVLRIAHGPARAVAAVAALATIPLGMTVSAAAQVAALAAIVILGLGRGPRAGDTGSPMTTLELDTPHGRANAYLHAAAEPRAALVLGHGAGGGDVARPHGGHRRRAL